MIKEFNIKGMICSRCVKVLRSDLAANEIEVVEIELGRIKLDYNPAQIDTSLIEKILMENEFEVIHDQSDILAEETKKWIINFIWNTDNTGKLSSFLSDKLKVNYSALSKNFSIQFGRTIERYSTLLKIERVKELIDSAKYNFSEISFLLGYQNQSALSRQFKRETGLSMQEYKLNDTSNRIPLDRI